MAETVAETDSLLKDGQVYRWRWADEVKHIEGLQGWNSYHCKSRIAVVVGGRLLDTYWHITGIIPTDGEVDPARVTLELLCDTSWPTIRDGEQQFYSADDLVDTRHENNSRAPIYLRPGAERSADAIRTLLARRQETAERDMRSAMAQMEHVGKMRLLLTEGRLGEVY